MDPSKRRAIQAQVLRYRQRADLAQEEVAARVGCSVSSVIRLEHGRSFPSLSILRLILKVCGATEEEIEDCLADATVASGESTWLDAMSTKLIGFKPLVSKEFFAHLAAESTAGGIRQYRSDVIPSLLQEPGYTAAVISAYWRTRGRSHTSAADAVATMLDVTACRQRIITPDGTPARFLLDEFVLLREIGGPKVMADAVRHMLDVAAYPSVSVRIVPRDAGGHIGLGGSYSILGGLDDSPASVVVGHPTALVYTINKPATVERYCSEFDRLAEASLSEEDTDAYLRGLL